MLPTLPRRSWLDRVLLGCASVLIAVSGWAVLAHSIHGPTGTGDTGMVAGLGTGDAIAFCAVGIALVARTGRAVNARLVALLPVAWAAFGLMETITGGGAGAIDPPTAGCVAVAGAVLAWAALPGRRRERRLVEAVAGSLIATLGVAVIFGHAANLPSVYDWGRSASMPLGAGAGAAVTGAALVAVAWAEQDEEVAIPAVWTPLPAVLAGLILTITFWAGLRARELAFQKDRSQEAMGSFARQVAADVEHESNALERLAHDWADGPPNDTERWAADAAVQLRESRLHGCTAIAIVGVDGRTAWIYPIQGNEAALLFDHRSVPARREALDRSVAGRAHPAISGSLDLGGQPHSGFAIYAPMIRDGRLAGWVDGDYAYGPLFEAASDQELGLTGDYRIAVGVGMQPIFDGGAAPARRAGAPTLDRDFVLFDRRIEVAFTPSEAEWRRDRQSLPEFALAAGLGMTGLLGLSLYLGQRARIGQRESEGSNRRLLAENEERRRVENRLKLADERLRLALDSTEIGIFEWNVPAGHVFYSRGLWAMLGYEPERMAPAPGTWQALLHPDDEAAVRAARDLQLAGESGFAEAEHRVKNASGHWRWVHTRSKTVASDAGGRPVRIIGTVQDVTARVETERQLRRAKAEADATSRAKSEFLASMSHEIRTPMNGIIGMTSLLLETELAEDQRVCVDTIRHSSEALLTIVNDILDFSKIESGNLELERAPFGLAVCLEEILDVFARQAADKNLELAYRIDPAVPGWIIGDVTRLWQVISNLINNAVKFTPSGFIRIEVRPGTGAPPGRVRIEFDVRDTGIGIPADRMDRLFKAFSQVDSSTTRKYGGTGLGLAICERLCQLMGGGIRVESEPGRGSTFIFTILAEPASIPEGVDLNPELPEALQKAPIVGFQVHPLQRERLATIFREWGADCRLEPDAASAAAVASALRVRPALLVLDNAAESRPLPPALAALRCPRLVVVPFGKMVDASGPPRVGSVAKPLKTISVMTAVIKLMERKAEASVAAPAASPARAAAPPLATEFPLRVLLAEDNPVNQKVALGLLQRLGYAADLAANGREAVDRIASAPYDLVLMDLQMPEMDGLEACRRIRALKLPGGQPKIVALTANALDGDREECIAAGMDDFVVKPVKLQDVAAAIRRHFARSA